MKLPFIAFVIGMICHGCSQKQGVHGTVTLDGTPVSHARVVFEATSGSYKQKTEAASAYGITSDDGRFHLQLVEDGSRNIPIGDYRVRVLTFGKMQLLPAKASDGSMEVSVSDDHSSEIALTFVSPSGKRNGNTQRATLTTGKEQIETKKKIMTRKTDNDSLPSRKAAE